MSNPGLMPREIIRLQEPRFGIYKRGEYLDTLLPLVCEIIYRFDINSLSRRHLRDVAGWDTNV